VAPLLAAYKTYFSQAYNDLRTAITDMRTAIDNALGDMQIATKIEKVIDQNAAAIEFWSRFCDFPAPAPPEGVGDTLRTLRQAALLLLDRKTAAPLDVVVPDATFSIAMAATDTQTQDIMGYNKDVTDANSIIATKKAATETSNVQLVESALAQLRLRKTRYRQEVVEACDAYRTAQQEKMRIEEEKAVVRKRLDDYTKEVIKKYEQTINALLADFNAGFSIAETKPAYFGGVASSTYRILINQTPVELGDEKTPLNKPSFRNTLSSGDKSTLALAFFLAQLLQDPNRSSRIVIFDDPFNSQDAFRKDHTVRKMRECGQDCAQVLVLSHDQQFLNRIWDCLREKAAERKTLELRRIGLQNTTILLWDIEAATQGAYKADRKVLTEFYHENRGDPRQVVQKIRPVLETYTKNLGAGALAEADTLGVIVGKIRTSGPTHQLYPVCDGLEELNIYTRRYMHGGENPNAATEPISDGELHGYVKRTLEITGGC
jgi:wobble nucleotide-excising tRNase